MMELLDAACGGCARKESVRDALFSIERATLALSQRGAHIGAVDGARVVARCIAKTTALAIVVVVAAAAAAIVVVVAAAAVVATIRTMTLAAIVDVVMRRTRIMRAAIHQHADLSRQFVVLMYYIHADTRCCFRNQGNSRLSIFIYVICEHSSVRWIANKIIGEGKREIGRRERRGREPR